VCAGVSQYEANCRAFGSKADNTSLRLYQVTAAKLASQMTSPIRTRDTYLLFATSAVAVPPKSHAHQLTLYERTQIGAGSKLMRDEIVLRKKIRNRVVLTLQLSMHNTQRELPNRQDLHEIADAADAADRGSHRKRSTSTSEMRVAARS
jgi:hypothetical protein